jgi:hypothetical protein
MDPHVIVPLVLFACVTYAFKAVLDAALRYRLVRVGTSEEMVRAVFDGEALRHRTTTLRWGVVLTAVGLGFALIDVLGWREPSPGSIGAVVAATGLGNLIYFLLQRRFS